MVRTPPNAGYARSSHAEIDAAPNRAHAARRRHPSFDSNRLVLLRKAPWIHDCNSPGYSSSRLLITLPYRPTVAGCGVAPGCSRRSPQVVHHGSIVLMGVSTDRRVATALTAWNNRRTRPLGGSQ